MIKPTRKYIVTSAIAAQLTGFLLIITGCSALFIPSFSSPAPEIIIGGLILISGFLYTANAFVIIHTEIFSWELAKGLIFMFFGCLLLEEPTNGMVGIGLLTGICFCLEGGVRIVQFFCFRKAAEKGLFLAEGLTLVLSPVVLLLIRPFGMQFSLSLLIAINLILGGGIMIRVVQYPEFF